MSDTTFHAQNAAQIIFQRLLNLEFSTRHHDFRYATRTIEAAIIAAKAGTCCCEFRGGPTVEETTWVKKCALHQYHEEKVLDPIAMAVLIGLSKTILEQVRDGHFDDSSVKRWAGMWLRKYGEAKPHRVVVTEEIADALIKMDEEG